MTLIPKQGELSKFKFLIADEKPNNWEKPSTFDTQGLELPEVTTSTITAQVSTTAGQVTKMYGSPKAGRGLTWSEPTPSEASWSGSVSGVVLAGEAQRANIKKLYAALGKYIYITVKPQDGEAWGGWAIVTSIGRPVPADGVVTFEVSFTGTGPQATNIT